jgi:hypothetical protein
MAPSPLPFLNAEKGRGDGQAREALFCSRSANLGPLIGPAAATGARVTIVPDPRITCLMIVVGPSRALVAIGANGVSPDGWDVDKGLWTVATADRAACPALVADLADWLRSLERAGGLGPLTADGVSHAAELLEELVVDADIVDTGHRLALPDMRVTGPGVPVGLPVGVPVDRAAAGTVAKTATSRTAVSSRTPVSRSTVSRTVASVSDVAVAGTSIAVIDVVIDEATQAALDAALDSLAEERPEWSAHRHGGRLLHVRSGNRGTFLQAAQALEYVTDGVDVAVWSTGPTSLWAIAARSGSDLFHIESDARGQVLWRHYRLGPLATPTALARNPELATRARVNHGPFRDPFPEAIAALQANGVELTSGTPLDCLDLSSLS